MNNDKNEIILKKVFLNDVLNNMEDHDAFHDVLIKSLTKKIAKAKRLDYKQTDLIFFDFMDDNDFNIAEKDVYLVQNGKDEDDENSRETYLFSERDVYRWNNGVCDQMKIIFIDKEIENDVPD